MKKRDQQFIEREILVISALCIATILSFSLDKQVQQYFLNAQNAVLSGFFDYFSNFTNVTVILVLITTLFLFEEKKREWIFPLWTSFALAIITSFLLKLAIARPRPAEEVIYPIIGVASYAFPSMHTMVAFACVPVLVKQFPRLTYFWFAFAIAVGMSRLYHNVHFFSDVVVGALLGYFIGYFIVHIEQKYRPFKFLQ